MLESVCRVCCVLEKECNNGAVFQSENVFHVIKLFRIH